MSQPVRHLEDETLSTLLDGQVAPADASAARAHLASCAACSARAEGFATVARLPGSLQEVEPPRDFEPGPRQLVDPPNVIRLRRWYDATRVAAASLAAVFVALVGASVYVGPAGSPESFTSRAVAPAP